LPVCDTLSRFGTFARPRAFFAGPGNRSCWRALPLRFSDAQNGFAWVTRATQSICRRRGCCAGPEWRFFAVEHVMRLARDTHLAALSERDERTAGAHPDSGPCVRDSLRTVAHARVIHQGRLFARRTATRMSMDDARPGRGVDELGVTPRHAPQSPFHDRRRSWDLSCPSQV
jgi:hypothetical protein